MNRPRGRFIVIEGIDGSGTTLQTRALAEALRTQGHRVVETREPTDDLVIGPLIRRALATSDSPLDPRALALLFAADRIDHVQRCIRPSVDAGAVVISDRYLLSSLAYQTLDCDHAWVRTINMHAPAPDLYFFLDVPVEIAFARIQQRRGALGTTEERFDVPALQRRVAAAYDEQMNNSAVELGERVRVDGTASPGQITQTLLAACRARGL
jgi:dTMP kinase